MELRQLRYFVHIAELESFSRASARLNIAQSALSRHVRLLETELGVELLQRHGRGAAPTAAGKLFHKRASRILRRLDDARLEVAAVGRGPSGQVNLALPPSMCEMFASPLLERSKTQLPNISLKLFEGWTGFIKEWLLVGRCDLGILYSSQVDDRIAFQPIVTDDLCLIASAKGGTAPRRADYSLEEIADLPLIVPPHPHGLRRVIESAFSARDLTPNIAYEAEVWSVIKELVESGLAYAILPPSEIWSEIADKRLVALTIAAPGIQRTLGVARKNEPNTLTTVEAVFELIGSEAAGWAIPH